MSWSYFMAGVVIGAVVITGGAVFSSLQNGVDADTACSERFGEEWSGEHVETDWENQTAMIECTNGTNTRRIGIDINAEVRA